MPHYFFDTWDNGELSADDLGLNFGTLQEVRRAAVEVLPQMAVDAFPDGATREFAVEVRDASGERIFRATLSFRSDWLQPASNDR